MVSSSVVALLCGTAWAELQPTPETSVCSACDADEAAVRAKYSDEEWQRILAGEIVIVDSKNQGADAVEGSAQAAALLRHPPKQVWNVLTDFESRPDYVSDMEAVRIIRRQGNRIWADEHMQFMFFDIRFRVINAVDPEKGMITWKMDRSVPHDIADTEGMWRMTPYSSGQNTLLSYRTRIDTGRGVPGFVEDFLLTRSLPDFIRSLQGEVARRFPE